METQKYKKVNVKDIEPWQETCGQIRCLIENEENTPCDLLHLEITDSKLHYHKKTDEYYYILEGSGTMIIDDDEISLVKGDTIYIPRGCKHKAKGKLSALIICSPRGVLNDVHELE